MDSKNSRLLGLHTAWQSSIMRDRMEAAMGRRARIMAFYKGPLDEEFDKHLDAIVGGIQTGAGFCFVSHERDIGWEFNDGPSAEISAQRLAEITRIKKVTLTLYNEEGGLELKEIKKP